MGSRATAVYKMLYAPRRIILLVVYKKQVVPTLRRKVPDSQIPRIMKRLRIEFTHRYSYANTMHRNSDEVYFYCDHVSNKKIRDVSSLDHRNSVQLELLWSRTWGGGRKLGISPRMRTLVRALQWFPG